MQQHEPHASLVGPQSLLASVQTVGFRLARRAKNAMVQGRQGTKQPSSTERKGSRSMLLSAHHKCRSSQCLGQVLPAKLHSELPPSPGARPVKSHSTAQHSPTPESLALRIHRNTFRCFALACQRLHTTPGCHAASLWVQSQLRSVVHYSGSVADAADRDTERATRHPWTTLLAAPCSFSVRQSKQCSLAVSPASWCTVNTHALVVSHVQQQLLLLSPSVAPAGRLHHHLIRTQRLITRQHGRKRGHSQGELVHGCL